MEEEAEVDLEDVYGRREMSLGRRVVLVPSEGERTERNLKPNVVRRRLCRDEGMEL